MNQYEKADVQDVDSKFTLIYKSDGETSEQRSPEGRRNLELFP